MDPLSIPDQLITLAAVNWSVVSFLPLWWIAIPMDLCQLKVLSQACSIVRNKMNIHLELIAADEVEGDVL